MVLSDEHIEKLQLLYKVHLGKEISKEEAYESGIKLLGLVELVYKPMTKENFLKLQRRRKELGLPEIEESFTRIVHNVQ